MLARRMSANSRRMASESELQVGLTVGVSVDIMALGCKLASDA